MDFKNITDLLSSTHGDAISIIEDKKVIMASSEKWIEIAKLPDVVVNFKIHIYQRLKEELINLKLN